MSEPNRNISSMIREHKTVFIIIAVVLFLVELEIFAIAAMKSGRKSWLQFYSHDGNLIHETDGKNLSDFNKYYFEHTHGPVENFQVKLVTKENPFPFRAWFVAAVGVPMGIILMFAFIVKAFSALFYGDTEKYLSKNPDAAESGTNFERIIAGVSRFNIFVIGFLIFAAVLAYWILPEFVIFLGKIGAETFDRYKWLFISAGLIAAGVVIWVIYLKYLLARKTIDSQTELTKFRLQLEMNRPAGTVHQLSFPTDSANNRFLDWEEENQRKDKEP